MAQLLQALEELYLDGIDALRRDLRNADPKNRRARIAAYRTLGNLTEAVGAILSHRREAPPPTVSELAEALAESPEGQQALQEALGRVRVGE